MHVHFLGVCGTFMAGLALIARELGHRVTGSDHNVYPPMSEVLARAAIDPIAGYDPAQLEPAPDVVVVGNSMIRGNPCVEHILETGLPHTSGPAWLSAHVLAGRHVVAVAGTHGKTTTTAMIAFILEAAGLDPGFLVGGIPRDLDAVARVGRGGPRRLFVIEADEYDTAFFDKRSKFLHYRPRTLVLNNLEFDHADIFRDLADMQRQFHHVVRIVPAGGRIVAGAGQRPIDEVLAMGCWSPVERVGAGGDWSALMATPDGSRFQVRHHGRAVAEIEWEQRGAHNVANALTAIAAARHAGIEPALAARALGGFKGVRRRLEHHATVAGIAIYDDFAHHPTAIEASIGALRATRGSEAGAGRLLAVLELASNTMRRGTHRATLGPALAGADAAWVLAPAQTSEAGGWDPQVLAHEGGTVRVRHDIDTIVRECGAAARPGDAVLMMSNAGFGGIRDRLAAVLRARTPADRDRCTGA
ncbi:MAG: UDP-N-acetylmuramate:L-alanyl-gamma-D-glutamyl-meso-diaminopimelate ligase [Thiotrichales bacterium]|nr:UDP-N-acetylmuramate:L-alanyl-gamma-D-glutamyl-meso-diaminopimelate ligase [Thiotrichales bacterium]